MKVSTLFRFSIFKTIYFNFKMLPFKQAIKLPIIFMNKTRFINLSGVVKINGPIKRGMISIGSYHSEMITPLINTIDLKGEMVFNGAIQIGCGCLLRAEKNALIQFGKKNIIGANTKIFSEKFIDIGDYTRIAWETQLFDTNFHYLLNTKDSSIIQKAGNIILGNYNWIGNRSSIMKGTITPDYTIVASNSFCNKDYTKEITSESIIGGTPAKLIAKNIIRVFNKQQELDIEKEIIV